MKLKINLLAGCGVLCALAVAQRPASPPRLTIVVLEGQGAINNISQHRAKEPVVQVLDESNMPVIGASVTFLLPDTGPTGEFGGGLRTLAVMTDDKGEAAARGLVPNQNAGAFQIRVVTSFQGQMASVVINQTNAEPARAAGGSSKKLLLIAVVGGAVAAGVAFAARGHSGSTPAPGANQPAIVISSGTPAFQPPH